MKYALLVAYDGTNYGGWQIQKNSITVQQKLEEACKEIFGVKTNITEIQAYYIGIWLSIQACLSLTVR